MIYSYRMTIPKSTTKANPTTYLLSLPHGIIHRLIVGFPPGPHATAHVAIWHKEHQIFPSDPDQDFGWDWYVLDTPEWYPIEDFPYSISIRGWNDDTVYPHQVWIAVAILPREILMPPSEAAGILQRLSKLIFGK